MKDFRGKKALVTGAGSGIGRALVLALTRAGAEVAATDIDGEAAEKTWQESGSKGGFSASCDIADIGECRRLASRTVKEFGALNLLCAHAGIGVGGSVAGMKPENRRWGVAVNIEGMLNTLEAFLPGMQVGDGERHVMMTGSMAGFLRPRAGMSFYAMTKYAVIGMAEGLRSDLAGSGVTASVLCPGLVRTRIWASVERRQKRFGGPRQLDEERGKPWEAGLAPEEVADAALEGLRAGEFYILVPSEDRQGLDTRNLELREAFDKGRARLGKTSRR